MLLGFSLLIIATLTFLLVQTYRDRVQLQQRLTRYSKIVSLEDYEQKLDTSVLYKSSQLESLEYQIKQLKLELPELEEKAYLWSFGFYEPEYDYVTSGKYESSLKEVKEKQKNMTAKGFAARCNSPLNLRKSERDSEIKTKKEGEKMINSFLRLMLKIFNSECDDIVSKVKHSNREASEEKIRRRFRSINKTAKIIDCEITNDYLALKIEELDLTYKLACKQQVEKEKERALKDEAKEQRKLQKELRDLEKAEEKENKFREDLENALREQEKALGKENEQLANQIQKLRADLLKAEQEREKASDRVRGLKEGYIYVISNIGSFGKDVYRICMTRRLRDPDAYITAMNPSTPFPFDVHFKFLSEDALDTIKRLHQRFQSKRVNRFNERREFFKVSFDEIEMAIEEIAQETGVLKSIYREKMPQAYEYRRTKADEQRKQSSNSNHGIA